jgi:hypothetical protein
VHVSALPNVPHVAMAQAVPIAMVWMALSVVLRRP